MTYDRLKPVQKLPLSDLAGLKVYQAVIDLASLNDHDICNPYRFALLTGVCKPCLHLCLARLMERDDIEEDVSMCLRDQ